MAKAAGKEKTIEILNEILEHELSGVVRYSHYALMIFGHNRIPICKWLRDQAQESLLHANQVGEHITSLGGHPSLKIGKLLETHKHAINDILNEALVHEGIQLDLYKKLLKHIDSEDIWLEEYARTLILEEEMHIHEVQKMLRTSK